MLEIFQNFEQITGRLSPVILIVPGLILVLAGLFIWLGGLGFRKTLVVIIGAVGGGTCGFLVTGSNVILTLFSAVLCAVIAVLFEKTFITIMAAALTTALVFAVLAGAYIESPGSGEVINQSQLQNGVETVDVKQSLAIIQAYVANLGSRVKYACREMPAYGWAIVTIPAVVFGLAGFFLWRLTSALYCSTLGTILVFAGMILLLSYKGAAPITGIGSRQSYYAVIFMTMTAFGTVEQLLLCTGADKKENTEEESDKNKKSHGGK